MEELRLFLLNGEEDRMMKRSVFGLLGQTWLTERRGQLPTGHRCVVVFHKKELRHGVSD
jgi:hypothetical protein